MSFFVPEGWQERQWSYKHFSGARVLQNNPWGAISETHLDRPIPRDQWYQAIGANEDGNPAAVFSYPREYFDGSKVIAFPEVIIGNKFGTLDSGAEGFPIQVKNIERVDIDFRYNMMPHPLRPSETPLYNVAIETFFHAGHPTPIVGPGHADYDRNNTQHKFELMVWLETPKTDEIGLGDELGEIVDQNGNIFSLHSYAANYCAFLLKHRKSALICWSDFIAAVNERTELLNIDPEWRISAFESGPEIWTGAGLFEWLNFSVDIKLRDDEQPNNQAGFFARLADCHREIARLYDDMAAL